MALRIEIGKNYNNLYDLRIGDLDGCENLYNMSLEEVLEAIKKAIQEELK